MDEVHAILLIYDLLPFFNDINGILCIFLLKGFNGYRPSRYLESPTGTTEALFI